MNKYERIALELRDQIRTGRLKPGERIPAEQAIRTTYKVSLPVVRQALDLLEAEGLIDRVHGRGTYVRAARQRIRRTTERYQWEKDRVRLPEEQRRQTGATERDTGLSMGDLDFYAEYHTVPASDDLADLFGVAIGAKLLQRIYRTRCRQEDSPLSLTHSYLVYDVVAHNSALLDADNEPWPGGTHHQLSTIGIEIDRIVDQITARPPTPAEMETLSMSAGVPVFTIRKISTDTRGHVVEVTDIVTPADRLELCYTTSLERWPS